MRIGLVRPMKVGLRAPSLACSQCRLPVTCSAFSHDLCPFPQPSDHSEFSGFSHRVKNLSDLVLFVWMSA